MKSTFSERMGYTNPKTVIQFESIDDSLRNTLWNLIYDFFFKSFIGDNSYYQDHEFGRTFMLLWTRFYKLRIDEAPRQPLKCIHFIKDSFFTGKWYEVYDFIEFIIANYSYKTKTEDFIFSLNQKLEEELSGYRVISNIIAPIISQPEVLSIESALQINEPVSFHINEALKLLSDKAKPDFRNSIKESISSVEAITRLITGNTSATLGAALTAIEKSGKIKIHGALKEGFSSLYGWTSSDQGIRHSLLEAPSVSQEDAVYMLIVCSAFVNYLNEKTLKVGMKLR